MMLSLLAAAVLAANPVSLEFDGTLSDGLKQLAQKSGLNLVVIGDLDDRVKLNLPSVDGEAALETIAQAYGLEVTRSAKSADGKLWVVRRAGATAARTPAPVPEPEAIREAAERVREKADATRDAALEQADAAREAAQEKAEAAREAAEAEAEAAREKAEAAREQAEAAREAALAQADAVGSKADLARDRVSTGAPVIVEAGSTVETAVAYGGPVIIKENAVVEGDAVAFGGDVVLEKGAVVHGDAVSFGGDVVRDDAAKVHGEIVAMGGSSLGSAVARNVVRSQRAANRVDAEDADDRRGFGRGLAGFLAQFAVFFGLGFVLMLFAPQRMKVLETTIRSEPGKNGLVGFLGLIATVPLTIMLVVTLVGIPVAMLMWAAIALIVPVGLAVVANALGAKVPTGKLRKTQALVLALGLLVLLLVSRVPVVGAMTLSVAVLISLGAIIRTRFGGNPRGQPMLDPMRATV